MSEPGGSRAWSMPQRRNCRQSNIGLTRALSTGMLSGGVPSRMRSAISPRRAASAGPLRIMPPTTPLPDVRLERAVDRHRRGLGNFREQLIGKDHASLGYRRVTHVQDQAVGGQRLERRQHPGQRRLVAVGDGHTRREGGESRFDALAESSDRRRIGHHVETLRAWMELEREIQRLDLRRFAHDAGDTGDLSLQQRRAAASRLQRGLAGSETARPDAAARIAAPARCSRSPGRAADWQT